MPESTAPVPGGLAKKLSQILAEVDRVPKTGFNAFHKYKFVTESDLSDTVRKHLADKKVFIFTSVDKQTVEQITEQTERGPKTSTLTLIETTHTFVDGDTGESFAIRGAGQAADRGDKGIYKAITGAVKYMLYKNFLISTGDDPERDNEAGDGAVGHKPPAGAKSSKSDKADPGAAAPKPAEFHVLNVEKPGDWKNVVVCIEKSADFGKKLGELDDKHLQDWFDKWNPKGKAPAVLNLRAALDMWAQEKLDSQNGKK